MTFDTGHVVNLVERESVDAEKYKVWLDWISAFKDDIRLFHISPNKDVSGVKNRNLINFVYQVMCDEKMNADAFVENHFSFKDNDVLVQVCWQVQEEYENIVRQNDEERNSQAIIK